MTQCSTRGGGQPVGDTPCAWFGRMIENCLQYATTAKAEGRPIVGILCEYSPRELIMAAGAVPVCLCGGSAATIPAAEQHLPVNLCPLIKSTYGYHVQRSNPFMEMMDLIVGETTCDGKKKMYDLLAESRPVYVLELPQKADDPDAREYWVHELGKFRAFLEKRFGTAIISSMCIVFAETETIGLLASGVLPEDIAAGVQTALAVRRLRESGKATS